MSDKKSDNQTPGPLTADEMRQVLSGWNQWVQQPVMAGRFFTKLMQAINILLGAETQERIMALEEKVAELEKRLPKPPASPQSKNKTSSGSDLDKI